MGPRSLTPLILTALMIMMSWGALMDAVEETETDENSSALETKDVVLKAPSPGHVVFAEYVGGQNCPPCYGSASPSLTQLKGSNTDEFVYISYISAQYQVLRTSQAGESSPINRISHLDSSGSNSAPRAYFGQCAHGSTTCYKSGAGGTNTYDNLFSGSGGMSNNMHSTVNDYAMSVTQTPNGNDVDITVEATYLGTGTKTVSVFAAVTEYTCHSYPYADGSKPHNCFKKWLTNTANNGFAQLTLSSTPASVSWTVPKSTVYNGDTSNMLTVAALQSGWSSGATRYDVYSATDSDMNPMDLSVTDMTVTNLDATSGGFQTGDMLKLDATIGNTGQEDYSAGGQIQFYQVTSSGSEVAIGQAVSLNSLTIGLTQSVSAQFDTINTPMDSSDPSTVFRVKLTGTTGEKNVGSNNMRDVGVAHDLIPTTSKPISTGQTSIPRGQTLDFEVTGMSNDNVDDMSTMSAEFETSVNGVNQWTDAWVTGGTLMGAGGGNERFLFTVSPPNSASSGGYDVRAKMIDARGQIGEWSTVNSNAFTLQNGLPMVVTSENLGEVPLNCPTYPGQPTVKVETIEQIDVTGLICDAETPLDQLVISSTNPAFREWDPVSGEIEVRFDSVNKNPQGEVLTQPLQLTINDGEDGNSGTLNIMVIENGAPRWSSLPTQSFNEGSGTSIILTPYLSDTDSSGESASPMGLVLSVEYISNNSLLTAQLNGHTLNIDAVDDTVFGTGLITVKALDSDGQFAEAELTVIIANINDAPTLDVSSFENLRIKVDEEFIFNVADNMFDVDDPVDPINVIVSSDTWKTGSRYNALSGEIKAWFDSEGTHTISIVVRDSHDATTVYDVTLEVIDNLPLVWSSNPETGDLMIQADNLYVGEWPTYSITHQSNLGLTDIEVEWTICNIESGICSDFGFEAPSTLTEAYNFTVTKEGGVLFHDQIKVVITATDADGFERKTRTPMLYDITQERPEVVDDSPDESTTDGDTLDTSGNAGMVVYGIIGAFIVALLIALTLGVMLLRGGKEEELGMGFGATPSGMPPTPTAALATALDYTKLTPGGNYVTNDAGQTVYLSPDDTDWTMQADNSFVRTR